MEVDIEVQGTAEALDQGDRARLGRLAGEPSFSNEVRGDTAVDDAERLAHDHGAAGRGRLACRQSTTTLWQR